MESEIQLFLTTSSLKRRQAAVNQTSNPPQPILVESKHQSVMSLSTPSCVALTKHTKGFHNSIVFISPVLEEAGWRFPFRCCNFYRHHSISDLIHFGRIQPETGCRNPTRVSSMGTKMPESKRNQTNIFPKNSNKSSRESDGTGKWKKKIQTYINKFSKDKKKKSAKQLKGEKMNENKSWKKFHFFKKKIRHNLDNSSRNSLRSLMESLLDVSPRRKNNI